MGRVTHTQEDKMQQWHMHVILNHKEDEEEKEFDGILVDMLKMIEQEAENEGVGALVVTLERVRSHDAKGREYAKLKDLTAGDVVEVDDGFDCMAAGRHTVRAFAGDTNRLYLHCLDDHHFLDGQLEGEYLIGIYRV